MKDLMKSKEKTAAPEPEKKGDISIEEEQKLKKKVSPPRQLPPTAHVHTPDTM
jgi:hypothetical protein